MSSLLFEQGEFQGRVLPMLQEGRRACTKTSWIFCRYSTKRGLGVGAPSHVLRDLKTLQPGEVLRMGNPPVRVDLLQRVDGLDFEAGFARRVEARWHGMKVSVIHKEDLLASKLAAGRSQEKARRL